MHVDLPARTVGWLGRVPAVSDAWDSLDVRAPAAGLFKFPAQGIDRDIDHVRERVARLLPHVFAQHGTSDGDVFVANQKHQQLKLSVAQSNWRAAQYRL